MNNKKKSSNEIIKNLEVKEIQQISNNIITHLAQKLNTEYIINSLFLNFGNDKFINIDFIIIFIHKIFLI